jgi:esterase/lipase superfamily enzyme
METITGFPFFPVEMTKEGQVFHGDQVTALMQHAGGLAAPVDLLVLVHGWNNDMTDAKALYAELLGNIGPMPGRQVDVMGVFWPSKRFADSELIAGGGIASVADSDEGEALRQRLLDLTDVFDGGDASALAALVDRLDESGARADFVAGLRRLLPADLGPDDDGTGDFFDLEPERMFVVLEHAVTLSGPQDGGGIAAMPGGGDLLGGTTVDIGGGDIVGGPAGGIAGGGFGFTSAAGRLLNLTTYYQMKARAGLVGAGLNFVLAQIRAKIPGIRIHLVGHSFGARAVTAAVDGATPFQPASLTLLQGAFSHNSLTAGFDGDRNGAFSRVVEEGKVAGPIAITHTANDRAVGLAYALVSRLAGEDKAAFGDENDRYGGIGRNGAIKLKPEKVAALTLPAAGVAIPLTSGKVNNLIADERISGHSDVRNPAVAALVRAALG